MSPLPHEARNAASAANSSNTPSSAEQMKQMLAGYWAPQVVYAAARFGLADHLRRGGLTAEEFARAEGLDARAAHRFLRICASLGLAAIDRDGRFNSTSLLETLRRDHPQALRDVALAHGAPDRRFPWRRFVEAARTGERGTVTTLSPEVFDNITTTVPLEAKTFTEATGSLTDQTSDDVAQWLDTRAVDFVVDLGGAEGALLFALLRANPAMAGVVFDRPEVALAAKAAVQAAGLGDRAAAVGGDFLQSVPDEGDLYLLNNVLHDWDDGECVTILRNCRRAMRVGGRVVVVERLPADTGEAPMDVMTMLNGRERTLSDYRTLFTRVGLGNVRVTDTGTAWVILEAFAISDAWL